MFAVVQKLCYKYSDLAAQAGLVWTGRAPRTSHLSASRGLHLRTLRCRMAATHGSAERIGLGQSVAGYLVETRPNIYYPSLSLAFIVMVLLSIKRLQHFHLEPIRAPWFVFVSKYAPDVVVIQAVSLILLMFLAYRFSSRFLPFPRHRIAIFVVAFYSFVMVMEFACEELFLKPTFRYGRPVAVTTSKAVTEETYGDLWRYDADQEGGAPSGFTLRQTMILMLFLSLAHQRKWREAFSAVQSRVYHWIYYVSFASVPALRFYHARHSLFDIGVGVGIAVMMYWFFTLSANFIFNRSAEDKRYLGESITPLACYSLAILFYCQETKWWMCACGLMFISIGLIWRLKTAENSTSQPAESNI